MLRFFRRSRALPVLPAPAANARGAGAARPDGPRADGACTLGAVRAGSWATVVEMTCGDQEACRLRALGICEGARVNVVDARHATLLEVRGTRVALGRALSDGITVRPIAGDGLAGGRAGGRAADAAPAPAR